MYAAIGGLSAVLAHRGVSVFHDGLRPTIPSVRNGEMSRKEVSRISFALAWGFFWAFGLPFSVGFVVPLVYVIFMLSDWIGVSTPADHTRPWYGSRAARQGVAIAFVAGAAYGAAMAVALHLVTRAMHDVPVEMADVTPLFSKPALGVFLLFAILTAAYHFGVRRAAPTVVAGLAGWIFGEAIDYGQPASWGFVAAFVVLIAQLVQQIRAPAPPPEGAVAAWAVDDEDDDADEVFGQVRRIKSAAIPIVALAALMGAAYNWGFMAKDPVSGELYSLGLAVPAALVMLAWAFAFIPMKFTTAAVTGCMATGTFLDAGLAFLMPSPWVAAIAVGALRLVEIWSILPLVRLFERAPSIREVADVMRTAIFHVVEIGFLIGGALAAFQWAGELGFAAVIGAWWLNSRANSPVMPMSIGPTAALAVGVVANVLHVVGVPLT
ncbi:MAG: hypothetical protein QOE60_1837 [Thermoleophilaceae bacterium]|nr:hypothetical protein [Thermoleophilaceae bacterium]